MKEVDYTLAIVFALVVSICYLIIGFITSVMSGIGNILLIFIYSFVVTFFMSLFLSSDDVSDAKGYSGMIFVISSIIFLHTSAPIWGENQYCQSQYALRGSGNYSFEYGELREDQNISKAYGYCKSKGGFTYMMDNGEIQPGLFRLSSVISFISLFILMSSHIGDTISKSSSKKRRRKVKKPINLREGYIQFENELLSCEKIVNDSKVVNKTFYSRLMKIRDSIWVFEGEFELIGEGPEGISIEWEYFDKQKERLKRLQDYALEHVDITFEGNDKKINEIKYKFALPVSEQDQYYSDKQHEKWWRRD